jgi:hypothetical protein
MNKQRKTSHILNVFQYDADGHVVLPASLTLGIAPAGNDNSGKVGTTAWVRTYVSGLSYQGAITLTTSGTSGAATLVGNTLNIPTYTLAGLGGQAALSGTGFVKISGTTISYDNNTYATETYVGTQIANLVDSSPATLDTLNELAAALGDDPNFATTVATSIGTKQAQLNGTGFVKVTGTTVSYDNSTYLTTGTAGTTYVPYTGATGDVNLGVYNLAGGNININGSGSSGGALRLKQYGSSEANLEGYNSISTLTSGVFYFTSSASVPNFKNFALNPSGLTDNTLRTYALPDASGTIALTSNIPTVSGTSGYISKFTGSSTIGNSLIYDTGSILLIGATTASDNQSKLELINNGPVGLKIKSSAGNGNNTFLSIESSKEWRFVTNRGDLISGNQGDLIIRNNTDGVNAIILNQSGAATFSSTLRANGGNITSFSSIGAAGFDNGITIYTQPGTYTAGHGGILQFQNEDVITGGIRAIRDGGSWGGALLFYTHNTTAGNTFGTTFTENMKLSNDGILSVVGDILTGINKGIKFDSSGSSGHPEISVDSSVNLNFKNSAGTTNLTLSNNGAATFSSSITTSGNINVNSDGIFINRTTSGEPYIFFRKDSVNRASIYGVTGGGLRIFDESDNQVLTITGTRLGINKSLPSGTLDVQSSGANGIVLSSDSADTNNSGRLFFMRTGGEGWVIMNNSGNLSFRNNSVPGSTSGNERMRLDTSYNLILNNGLTVAGATNHTGAVRMNNGTGGSSPRITFGTEDESVPGNKSIYLDNYWMILQPHVNEGLRVRFVNGSGTQTETVRLQSTQASFYTSISSSGSISASGNLTARNFSRNIKSWAPPGSTGSGASTTYNWADELAALAGNFDSGGYYRGFIRSGNGAHYYGYHFDILVGSQGYGGNSLQYKVQNVVGANSPWAGGCGFPPFGTVDNTNFTHVNNPCGEYLELYITKLGG